MKAWNRAKTYQSRTG